MTGVTEPNTQSRTNLEIDDLSRLTARFDIDRPTAHRAVFDEGLLSLRSIDSNWEGFAAMGTSNLGIENQLHSYETTSLFAAPAAVFSTSF